MKKDLKDIKEINKLLIDLTFNEMKYTKENGEGLDYDFLEKLDKNLDNLVEGAKRQQKFRLAVQFLAQSLFDKMNDWDEEKIENFAINTDFDKFDLNNFEPGKEFRKDGKGKFLDDKIEELIMGFVGYNQVAQFEDIKSNAKAKKEREEAEEAGKKLISERQKGMEEYNKQMKKEAELMAKKNALLEKEVDKIEKDKKINVLNKK